MHAKRNGAPLTKRALLSVLLAVGLLATATTYAGIVGFDPASYTLNAGGTAAANGKPKIDAGVLYVTGPQNDQWTSAFYNTQQGVEVFTAQFDYQNVSGSAVNPADGIAFVVQGNGPTALGGGGGARGYGGMGKSFAALINVYAGSGAPGINTGLNGNISGNISTSPLDTRDGVIRTKITYDGLIMKMDLENLSTGKTFSYSTPVDIKSAVGSGMGYVGFSGATGGLNADQRISNFTYSYTPITTLTWNELGTNLWSSPNWIGGPPASPDETTSVVLSPTNIDNVIVTSPSKAFTLSVQGGGIEVSSGQSLSVHGAAKFAPGTTLSLSKNASFSANGGTVSSLVATLGNATVTTQGTMEVGSLLGNVLPSTAGRFTKKGPGTLALDNSLGTGVVAPKTTFVVAEGTLSARGENPLGGATQLELAGGRFTVYPGMAAGAANELTENFYSGDATSYIDPLGAGMGYLARTPLRSHLYSQGGNQPMDITSDDQAGDGPGRWHIRSEGSIGANDPNNFGAVWYGKLNIGAPGSGAALTAGDITFGTASDDGTTVWIDGKLVVNNNAYQGRTERTATVNLTAGVHDIYIGYYEGGGGNNFEAAFKQGANVAYGDLIKINPTDAAQKGLWSAGVILPVNLSSIQTTVTAAGSVLDPRSDSAVMAGPLKMNDGATLATTGAPSIKFAGTTIDPAATRVGFDPQVTTDYGPINASNAPVMISKLGSGNWTLPAAPTNLGPNSSWKVEGGMLQMNTAAPLGGRPVNVSGGSLYVIGTTPGAADVTLSGGKLLLQAENGAPVVNELTENFYSGDAAAYIDPLGFGKGYMANLPLLTHLYSKGGNEAMDITSDDQAGDGPARWNVRSEGAIGQNDPNNFGAVWYGKVHVGAAGSGAALTAGDITFGTASDDGSTIFIDGQRVVNNNAYQGRTEKTATINLAEGDHEIFIGYYEGGGGNNMEAAFKQGANVAYGDLTKINPTDPAQQGIWSAIPLAAIDAKGMNIKVTQDSSLDTLTNYGTALGDLTIDAGKKLTIVRKNPVSFSDVKAGDGGTIEGNISIEDLVQPGNSPGTLNVVGNLTLDGTSVYGWELVGAQNDLINVSQNLTTDDGWTLKIETADAAVVGNSYTLFTYGGTANVGSVVFDVTGTPGWDATKLAVVDDQAGKVLLQVVPEPSTVVMLLSLAAMGFVMWRRRR